MSRDKRTWDDLGTNDPYYAVLAFDKFLHENLDDRAVDEFFKTGRSHVERIWREIKDGFGIDLRPKRALDYGCGVGRNLIPLAERCETVYGVDISHGMLAETAKNCDEHGIQNVHLQDAAEFWAAESEVYDFVHSFIVLQHIDPKIGNVLIRKMIERLEPGGVGVVHVTFFDPSTHFQKLRSRFYSNIPKAHQFLTAVRGKKGRLMPMYEYDLNYLFRILKENGSETSFLRFSDHGWLGALIFFRKTNLGTY